MRAPNGQIVCRSSINANSIPDTSPFPAFNADPNNNGVFEPVTFRTNDGTCSPLNLFGLGSPSAEAVAFVNPQAMDKVRLEQFVANAYISGTTESFFRLPGGGIGLVAGAEYRREKSVFSPDPRDIAGQFYESGTQAESGSYSVKEVFGEIDIPIAKDVPFFETLTLHGSARLSDYTLTRVGKTFTWGGDAIWSPVRDIRFRGSISRSIRAPNITNLFSPRTPATFRPIDPCDTAQIGRGPRPATRLANCRADGIPAGFTDPLTARITGATGGNVNLEEETSDSFTYGVVLQPRFVPGLTITADYWNYNIKNAIANVTADEIVSGCYDDPTFPANSFCSLFTRNRVAGPTFLGFNFLLSGPVNFARFKTDGIDVTARLVHDFEGFGRVTARFGATYVRNYSNFTSVTNPNSDDPAVGEAQVPRYAFNTGLAFQRNGFRIEWESFWQSPQYYGAYIRV